jgi:hypothetical protein
MNRYQVLAYFVLALTFITELVMLSLQLGAYKRHGHVSFLLLSIATGSALFYIAVGQILGLLRDTPFSPPMWLFAAMTIPLFVQMIVGVWGTVLLFRSYDKLNSRCDASPEVGGNA